MKIRGTAANVYEKYLQLARDANSGGDRVMAENYLQHAEHYYRIMNAAGEGQAHGQPRPNTPADFDGGDGQGQDGQGQGGQGQPQGGEAIVQTGGQAPSPRPVSHEAFVRELEETHRAPDREDAEQPPYRDEQPPTY